MIERGFIKQNKRQFEIEEYIRNNLRKVGHSHTKLLKTPLGDMVVIYTSRPGLIVGRKGANIKKMTQTLKEEFGLDNPQIEIVEVELPMLDPQIVAENIAMSLERFGTSGFKGVGHKMMSAVIGAGAYGVEILISGKIPGARAKRWRFYQGYLKKCGDIALEGVRTAYTTAELKSGVIGIQVRIMPSTTKLPDDIKIFSEKADVVEGIKEEIGKEEKEKEGPEETEVKTKKTTKKKETKDALPKKEEKSKKKKAVKKEKIEEKKDDKK